MSLTLQQYLQQDKTKLMQQLKLESDTARIEVQMLLQKVLQVSRVYLLTYPEHSLSEEQHAHYQQLLAQRLNGEPLAYILGEREFFGMNFKVTPATLIPRPDTEILVEQALEKVTQPNIHILDLGTGSGAIALSLAKQLPQAQIVGVDASLPALEVAEYNRQQYQLNHVALLHSNWFDQLAKQQFDLIVSNPPYIEDNDPHLAQGDVRFEPATALASGTDGLDDIRLIIEQAPNYLKAEGWLLFEHGYNQAEQVRNLLMQAGFELVYSAEDLAGIERVSGGRLLSQPTECASFI